MIVHTVRLFPIRKDEPPAERIGLPIWAIFAYRDLNVNEDQLEMNTKLAEDQRLLPETSSNY